MGIFLCLLEWRWGLSNLAQSKINFFSKRFVRGLILSVSFCAISASAQALSLKGAVKIALETNPEIGQAVENREATEFELKQALGLYLPRVDLEASVGAQSLSSPSRRSAGIEDDPLYPSQVELVVTYDLLDGGFRKSEANRQAARVDSASFRVLERSELTALEVTRLYFEIILQSRIVGLARNNLSFHNQTLNNVRDAAASGTLTNADRQQAAERVAAAGASVAQTREALEQAKIGFRKVVGTSFRNASMPARIGRHLPGSEQAAIDYALRNNSRVRIASADLSAAAALVEQSRGARGPKLFLEGRASGGNDISGTEGHSDNVQGNLVLRWNLFDGGIKSAKVQENIRREGQAAFGQLQAGRDVSEAVSTSWNRITRQNDLANQYRRQLSASDGLVSSYQQQFTIGQRSLLDVLNAQNTRYNVQVLAMTAQYSSRFAEFRLMAATGTLLSYLNLDAPVQAEAYALDMIEAPEVEDLELRNRKPVSFSAPINLMLFVN